MGVAAAELARFTRHFGRVSSVTVLPWPGLDHPVIASGSFDRTVSIWDPQPNIELARFTGHTDVVRVVTVLPSWPGLNHPVIASGSEDGTVRIWAASGSEDGTVWIWDSQSLRSLCAVPLFGLALAIAELEAGHIVVGTSRGLIFFDFRLAMVIRSARGEFKER